MPRPMQSKTLFKNGNGILVTTHGPGKLHLLSDTDSDFKLKRIVGFTETSHHGTTRFLIAFSHHYNRFSFYWDGSGEAVYGTADSLVRLPVGRSWADATEANRDTGTFSTVNVTREVRDATKRDRQTTVFIIPDL